MRSADDEAGRALGGARWSLPVQPRLALLLVCAGALAGAAGVVSQPTQLLPAYLSSAFYFLSLAVGAVAVLALLRLTGARWSAPLEPLLVAMGAYVPLGAASMLPIIPGLALLYPWADVARGTAYLRAPAFVARMLVVLAVWIGLGRALRRPRLAPERQVRWAALTVVGIGATFVVATFDWLVSIEYPWTSTLAPFANLAGALSAAVAALVFVAVLAGRAAGAPEVGPGRLRDLGRLLFGTSAVCGYLWFVEHLLVWYANLPDEVAHAAERARGGWGVLSALAPALAAGVPCLVLFRGVDKNSEPRLLAASTAILAGRFLELVLATTPAASPIHRGIGPYQLAIQGGFAGLFVLSFARALRSQSAVALVREAPGTSLEPWSTP